MVAPLLEMIMTTYTIQSLPEFDVDTAVFCIVTSICMLTLLALGAV